MALSGSKDPSRIGPGIRHSTVDDGESEVGALIHRVAEPIESNR